MCVSKGLMQLQGDPQKSDNKTGLVLAQMVLIVGARHHSWIGRYMHDLFVTLNGSFGDRKTRQNFGVTRARNVQLRHAWKLALRLQ